jgi:hypothetical protein
MNKHVFIKCIYKGQESGGDKSSIGKSLSFKVIDFEKCSMGPSGMDLGIYVFTCIHTYVYICI